jgi:hypothetical protein
MRFTGKIEEWKKWLLNYARNANKRIPVESAITMIRLNATRRLSSMRLANPVTSHQQKKKIEGRYDPDAPCDGGLGRWLVNCQPSTVIQSGGSCSSVC